MFSSCKTLSYCPLTETEEWNPSISLRISIIPLLNWITHIQSKSFHQWYKLYEFLSCYAVILGCNHALDYNPIFEILVYKLKDQSELSFIYLFLTLIRLFILQLLDYYKCSHDDTSQWKQNWELNSSLDSTIHIWYKKVSLCFTIELHE